jgi:phosphatidylglycerophosphate synthase
MVSETIASLFLITRKCAGLPRVLARLSFYHFFSFFIYFFFLYFFYLFKFLVILESLPSIRNDYFQFGLIFIKKKSNQTEKKNLKKLKPVQTGLARFFSVWIWFFGYLFSGFLDFFDFLIFLLTPTPYNLTEN